MCVCVCGGGGGCTNDVFTETERNEWSSRVDIVMVAIAGKCNASKFFALSCRTGYCSTDADWV